MSWENALLMKLSNDVEKYEIEVTKMGQNSEPKITVPHKGFKVQSWMGGPIPSHVDQCFQKIWSGGTNFFI